MLKNKGIIFIQKDKFEYYDEEQSKIFQFIFQPNLIQDLEIVDQDQLLLQIKTFIATNKITPANILYIVANTVIFEKDFQIVPNIDKNLEIQKFLENIPFEHVIYKIIDSEKVSKVLALNRELYDVLKFSLESIGFKDLGIVVQSTLGETFRNSQNLNADMIKYTLLHFDQLQKQTLSQEEANANEKITTDNGSTTEKQPHSPTAQNPLNKYRLPALLAVFIILFGVLSYFIYARYTVKSKASPVPSTIIAPSINTETPVPTSEEFSPSTPSATPL